MSWLTGDSQRKKIDTAFNNINSNIDTNLDTGKTNGTYNNDALRTLSGSSKATQDALKKQNEINKINATGKLKQTLARTGSVSGNQVKSLLGELAKDYDTKTQQQIANLSMEEANSLARMMNSMIQSKANMKYGNELKREEAKANVVSPLQQILQTALPIALAVGTGSFAGGKGFDLGNALKGLASLYGGLVPNKNQ